MAFSLRDKRCGGPVGLAGHTDGSLGTHAQDLLQLALYLSLSAHRLPNHQYWNDA
jgi:hypothetical protein